MLETENDHALHRDQSQCLTLAQLNAMDQDEFESALDGIVENSPWVVREAWSRHPFDSLKDLGQALMSVIWDADVNLQKSLLLAHPELAGREAIAGTMTAESKSEQGRLGLNALSPADHERLKQINRAYRERFGFPLIIALRMHNSLESVFLAAERRLQLDPSAELRHAIDQVGIVIQGRLEKLFSA
jgi:2-oxo-4-hydroxy-4-carboxy-5-ureidoimidazoline decarboxylase